MKEALLWVCRTKSIYHGDNTDKILGLSVLTTPLRDTENDLYLISHKSIFLNTEVGKQILFRTGAFIFELYLFNL